MLYISNFNYLRFADSFVIQLSFINQGYLEGKAVLKTTKNIQMI